MEMDNGVIEVAVFGVEAIGGKRVGRFRINSLVELKRVFRIGEPDYIVFRILFNMLTVAFKNDDCLLYTSPSPRD